MRCLVCEILFRTDVFRNANQIDFLEIIADHFFDPKPESNELLKLLASRFPLIPHGLGLSLGSADGLDRGYLNMLKRVVETVQPAWWSEHISFCRVGGIDIGHLTENEGDTKVPERKHSRVDVGDWCAVDPRKHYPID